MWIRLEKEKVERGNVDQIRQGKGRKRECGLDKEKVERGNVDQTREKKRGNVGVGERNENEKNWSRKM